MPRLPILLTPSWWLGKNGRPTERGYVTTNSTVAIYGVSDSRSNAPGVRCVGELLCVRGQAFTYNKSPLPSAALFVRASLSLTFKLRAEGDDGAKHNQLGLWPATVQLQCIGSRLLELFIRSDIFTTCIQQLSHALTGENTALMKMIGNDPSVQRYRRSLPSSNRFDNSKYTQAIKTMSYSKVKTFYRYVKSMCSQRNADTQTSAWRHPVVTIAPTSKIIAVRTSYLSLKANLSIVVRWKLRYWCW